jgi:hypothetical protein
MILAMDSHYYLPSWAPAGLIVAAFAAAVAVWAVLRVLARRRPGWSKWLAAARVVVLAGAVWLAMQASARVLTLATNWPLWGLAIGAAAVLEALLAFYRLERSIVTRRVGALLAGMRLLAAALVLAMLAQPVHTLDLGGDYRRYVAVLVDDSGSMQIADSRLTPTQKMRLGQWLGVVSGRALDADGVVAALSQARAALAVEAEWLTPLGDIKADARQRQMDQRRRKLNDAVVAARKTVEEQSQRLGGALSGAVKLDTATRGAIEELRARLGVKVRDSLAQLAGMTSSEAAGSLGASHARMLAALRQVVADLADMEPRLRQCGAAADEQSLAALPEDAKVKLAELARTPRAALAKLALERSGPDGKSALELLKSNYKVAVYRFVDGVVESSGAQSRPGVAPDAVVYSNYAAALERVAKDAAGNLCAGVILVGDGRHTSPRNPEDAARQLGMLQAQVCSIVIGSDVAPVDAAITSVDMPETIFLKDRVLAEVGVKLDGLAGKEAKVTLWDGQREIDSKTVKAAGDSFRTRVSLADTPQQIGTRAYRVTIDSFDGEVFPGNNSYACTANVTDDRLKILLVDGRPRWEFRYLKNLFADRDKTIALQYVLLDPDRIAGVPAPSPIVAAASRPAGEAEATALPEDPAEWLKFDTIILGDIPPASLKPQQLDALRRFVTERGGTLIVIAGRWYMPHAFAGTPLGELLPVKFQALDKAMLAGPETAYTIALTDEGRQSVIMRQKTDPQENAQLWASLPDIHWRHAVEDTKPGATVLAFALPPGAPDFLTGAASAPAQDEAARKLREDYERKNPLIVYHNVALGRVMFLAMDHTWRLRYRVGDLYHHKFWGQVLRWATDNKLAAGTTFVRLGSDRTRYAPGSAVTARAKLLNKDFSPCVANDVYVNVMSGKQRVSRVKLSYVQGSAGMYSAELGALPNGPYTMELDSPSARALLAAEGVEQVVADFSVDPATPLEQVELSANRGLLARLASLTGGEVVEAPDAVNLATRFGDGVVRTAEVKQRRLWDSWPLLGLIVLAVTVEWVVRKKVGLA